MRDMSEQALFGMGATLPPFSGESTEHVMHQRPLGRVLAFTGRSIDEVIDDPFVRRQIASYYKLWRWVERECEISELERQWIASGR
jgi:hypothetical protein